MPIKLAGAVSRRQLLHYSGIALGSTIVPTTTMAKQKKLGIALVGLGYYSTDELAPALQHTQHCYLAGIVTGSPHKAKRWQTDYGIKSENIYNYENFDEIAKNDDIDIVYIVLPNSMHKEFTIRAARAGKHVICEKPMALNAQECEEMIQVCEKEGVRLTLGYRMHFEPHTQHLMKLGKQLPYGPIKIINAMAGFYVKIKKDTNHWRFEKTMGGGWLMDIGVYAIQAARYCKQQEPISVTAQTSNTRPQYFIEVQETTTAQLLFDDGAVANVMGSAAAFVSDLNVICENDAYHLSPFWTYEGIEGGTRDETFDFPQVPQQVIQMDEMAISIRDNLPMRVNAEEGLKDMRIIDAIEKSVALGGKKVNLV